MLWAGLVVVDNLEIVQLNSNAQRNRLACTEDVNPTRYTHHSLEVRLTQAPTTPMGNKFLPSVHEVATGYSLPIQSSCCGVVEGKRRVLSPHSISLVKVCRLNNTAVYASCYNTHIYIYIYQRATDGYAHLQGCIHQCFCCLNCQQNTCASEHVRSTSTTSPPLPPTCGFPSFHTAPPHASHTTAYYYFQPQYLRRETTTL